ncbi:MAG: ATP-binding protein [Saprospiraceae bacterium]
MKLTKFDIGAEIISILTKGMYPDPRDAVREYIQNAVDAGAENINVKVRLNSVSVKDDGSGMDGETLRKSVRVGISEKNPKANVGFMGIGIYSAFHLCDKLTIHTRKSNESPIRLVMQFKEMREHLLFQKELRLINKINSEQLTDLQTLLESNINLTVLGDLPDEEFPSVGTLVELVGLDPILYDYLIDVDKISTYLRDVVPLHFEKKEIFKWGEEIEQRINTICAQHGAAFHTVNLKLQVNSQTLDLFRPYRDVDFHNDSPQEPKFEEIKKDGIFLGVAWGCLNGSRNKIADHDKRGFILKKQGFSIGNRENMVRFFGPSRTHVDRYVGEIVLVNPDILPNAARNDIETSVLKTLFRAAMEEEGGVASRFNTFSNDYQESDIAEKQLDEVNAALKEIFEDYTPYEENTDTLLGLNTRIDNLVDNISKKLQKKINRYAPHRKEEIAQALTSAKDLQKAIKERFNILIKHQKTKRINQQTKQVEIAEGLSKLQSGSNPALVFNNLSEVLNDLDFELSEELQTAFSVLDEKFVQALAKNNAHYQALLNETHQDLLQRLKPNT